MELAHVSEYDDLILRSIQELKTGGLEDQYSSVIVDEIQDLTESTMKLIRMIVPPGPDDLFLWEMDCNASIREGIIWRIWGSI
jgi:superfamily I DNA/RNA helicase